MANYSFGIEIEMIAEPHTIRDGLQGLHADYYRRIAAALKRRRLAAEADTLQGRYGKHPEHYDKWWITRDGSLELFQNEKSSFVPIEAVSPILSVYDPWKSEIDTFWTAMGAVFHQPKRSRRCGSHIHVRKSKDDRFSLPELKTIAFGIIAHEDLIVDMLMGNRVENKFCLPNSKASCTLQRTAGDLEAVKTAICAAHDANALYNVMQGNRYVLWNFENTLPFKSGTLEFRGGRYLRGPVRTKRWIAFTVALVHWLLTEKHIRNDRMMILGETDLFYDAIRDAAVALSMDELLPETYQEMNETER